MTLTKTPFLRLNKDDDNSIVRAGDYRYAVNLIPANDGVSGSSSLERIKGNKIIYNSLPSNTNKCIGVFKDTVSNKIIYFNYNENGNHGIFSFDPETNNTHRLMQKTFLDFNKDSYITGIGIVNDLLYWTDGINPARSINMSLDRILQNSDIRTRMHKKRPMAPPLVGPRSTDPTRQDNKISNDNYCFSYRYIYKDGQRGKRSPESLVSYCGLTPIYIPEINYIPVTCYIDFIEYEFIDRIQLLYQKNGNGSWYIWSEIKITSSSTSYNRSFYDGHSERALDDEDFNNSIPIKSSQLAIAEGRAIMTSNIDAYDMETSTAGMGLSLSSAPSSQVKPFYKEGGEYNFSVVYFDENGTMSQIDPGTKESIVVNRNYTDPLGSYLYKTASSRQVVDVSLSGQPPDWAHYYGIARTKEKYYETYVQVPARMHFFVGKKGDDFDNELLDGEAFHSVGDLVFYELPPSSALVDFFSNYKIWLYLPEEMSIVPKEGMFVRMITDISDVVEKVTRVNGQWIELQGNFGIDDWSNIVDLYPNVFLDSGHSAGLGWIQLLFEIYTPKENIEEEVYYLITQTKDNENGIFTINNPGTPSRSFSDTNIRCYGDTFYIVRSPNYPTHYGYTFHFYELDIVKGDALKEIDNKVLVSTTVESPVMSTKSSYNELTEIDTGKLLDVLLNIGEGIKQSSAEPRYIYDYSKIYEPLGPPTVDLKGKALTSKPKTLKWSNTFIQNSNFNGLADFESLNNYSIPLESSDITRLIPVNNVLLCMTKSDTYSIYLNENIVTYADGNSELVTSDKFIAQDRKLIGGYGTIHPESVVEHNGNVYWFDANKGEVLRYGQNGITPLAYTYKMKSLFKKLGDEIIQTPSAHVISGYDPYLNMLFITFLGIENEQTWGFLDAQGEERWVSSYTFIPECYACINNRFFSFKEGEIYEHNVDSGTERPSFYDEYFSIELKLLHNDEYSMDKIYESISVESNYPWSVEKATNPQGQETELSVGNFVRKDNTYYADFLRDKNTNTSLIKPGQIAIRHGKEMRGKVLDIELKNSDEDRVRIDFVNVSYKHVPGHRNV